MDAGVDIPGNVVQLPTKEALQLQVQNERVEREKACLAELMDVLKKHDCDIIPIVHIYAGRVQSEIKVQAK